MPQICLFSISKAQNIFCYQACKPLPKSRHVKGQAWQDVTCSCRMIPAPGRVLQEKLGGSLQPASQNPYPIYELSKSVICSTLFMTWPNIWYLLFYDHWGHTYLYNPYKGVPTLLGILNARLFFNEILKVSVAHIVHNWNKLFFKTSLESYCLVWIWPQLL